MYCQSSLRTLNCNHNIDKYFEINSNWVKDDFCLSCLEIIDQIETNERIENNE